MRRDAEKASTVTGSQAWNSSLFTELKNIISQSTNKQTNKQEIEIKALSLLRDGIGGDHEETVVTESALERGVQEGEGGELAGGQGQRDHVPALTVDNMAHRGGRNRAVLGLAREEEGLVGVGFLRVL